MTSRGIYASTVHKEAENSSRYEGSSDVYCLEPGHMPVFEEDTEILEFSPRKEYQMTIDVACRNMAAAQKSKRRLETGVEWIERLEYRQGELR